MTTSLDTLEISEPPTQTSSGIKVCGYDCRCLQGPEDGDEHPFCVIVDPESGPQREYVCFGEKCYYGCRDDEVPMFFIPRVDAERDPERVRKSSKRYVNFS
ncbi:hypothetical protein GF386_02750 [Candidatus Pacearchaeota archaeon]|nr:hypothetical protein [Candidatus Pacearchaeota archaeon]MBD3283067.1 hypothetical protein [Candidatus Pacearchaeota archaeon]